MEAKAVRPTPARVQQDNKDAGGDATRGRLGPRERPSPGLSEEKQKNKSLGKLYLWNRSVILHPEEGGGTRTGKPGTAGVTLSLKGYQK